MNECNCNDFSIFLEAVLPLVVAIFTVYAAEIFARKRDYKQKKIEIQIDYLKYCIDYLSSLIQKILELSRQADNFLNTNIEDRVNKYNEFVREYSNFNEEMLSSMVKLECIENILKININSSEIKRYLNDFSNGIMKIIEEYKDKKITTEANSKINEQDSEIKYKILIAMNTISYELSALLSGKK